MLCVLLVLQGLGTDDSTLIRVIVTRSEIDLLDIRDAFAKDYGKALGQFIAVSLTFAILINTGLLSGGGEKRGKKNRCFFPPLFSPLPSP